MRSKLERGLVVVVTLVRFGNCAVGPHYKRPVIYTPAAYHFAPNEASNSLGDWLETDEALSL